MESSVRLTSINSVNLSASYINLSHQIDYGNYTIKIVEVMINMGVGLLFNTTVQHYSL